MSRAPVSKPPRACASPAMPGSTRRRSENPGSLRSIRAASAGRSGRGPTRLISPRSTLSACGSSSRRYRRSTRPTGVARASRHCARTGPVRSSASAVMVRNLRIWNTPPPRPSRVLAVQHRARTGEPDRQRDRADQHRPRRQQHDQPERQDGHVERPLVARLPARSGAPLGGDHPAAAHESGPDAHGRSHPALPARRAASLAQASAAKPDRRFGLAVRRLRPSQTDLARRASPSRGRAGAAGFRGAAKPPPSRAVCPAGRGLAPTRTRHPPTVSADRQRESATLLRATLCKSVQSQVDEQSRSDIDTRRCSIRIFALPVLASRARIRPDTRR